MAHNEMRCLDGLTDYLGQSVRSGQKSVVDYLKREGPGCGMTLQLLSDRERDISHLIQFGGVVFKSSDQAQR